MRVQKFNVFDLFNIVVMIVLVVVTLYPLYYMGIISISAGDAVSRGEVLLRPIGMTLRAYEIVFDDPAIIRSYGNTLLYVSLGVCINLFMTSLCAYTLSRKHFYGRHLFSLFVIFTMFFDGGLIPRYIVVHSLGLVNTIWAVLVPTAINVFYMILMRTFYEQIPEELYESATVDGAGELKIWLRIIVPLSVPVMATMFLFYAVDHWNSFFPALIYLNDKELYPLQIILRNIVIQGNMAAQSASMGGPDELALMSETIKYAVVFVAILPILFVYPFLQKYFVQGAMLGSVKG